MYDGGHGREAETETRDRHFHGRSRHRQPQEEEEEQVKRKRATLRPEQVVRKWERERGEGNRASKLCERFSDSMSRNLARFRLPALADRKFSFLIPYFVAFNPTPTGTSNLSFSQS